VVLIHIHALTANAFKASVLARVLLQVKEQSISLKDITELSLFYHVSMQQNGCA
jgi:hypothetical protein